MSTITNYLNANFILSNTIESSIVTLEYYAQHYSSLFNLLHYPIIAQAQRPLLVLDADACFETRQCPSNAQVIKYKFGEKLSEVLSKIRPFIGETLDQKMEILIKGFELIQLSNSLQEINRFFSDILSIQQKLIQITVHLERNASSQAGKLVQGLATCRIIVDQEGGQVKAEMVMTKSSGHSFIKNYLIDEEGLRQQKLKVAKEVKIQEEEKDPIQEMQAKVKSSFNMGVNSQQKEQKEQLDEQINPYKKMKNLAKTPLIYKDEEDLKKMEIDLDEEDIDNEVESDDDLDV